MALIQAIFRAAQGNTFFSQKVPIIIVIWKTNSNTFENSLNTTDEPKMMKF